MKWISTRLITPRWDVRRIWVGGITSQEGGRSCAENCVSPFCRGPALRWCCRVRSWAGHTPTPGRNWSRGGSSSRSRGSGTSHAATRARRPPGLLAPPRTGIATVVIALTLGIQGADAAGTDVKVEKQHYRDLVATCFSDQSAAVEEVLSKLGRLSASDAAHVPRTLVETGWSDMSITIAVVNAVTTVTMMDDKGRGICTIRNGRVDVVLCQRKDDGMSLAFSLTDSDVIVNGLAFTWSRDDSVLVVRGNVGGSRVERRLSAGWHRTTLRQMVQKQLDGSKTVRVDVYRFANERSKELPDAMREPFVTYMLLLRDIQETMGLLLAEARAVGGTGLTLGSR